MALRAAAQASRKTLGRPTALPADRAAEVVTAYSGGTAVTVHAGHADVHQHHMGRGARLHVDGHRRVRHAVAKVTRDAQTVLGHAAAGFLLPPALGGANTFLQLMKVGAPISQRVAEDGAQRDSPHQRRAVIGPQTQRQQRQPSGGEHRPVRMAPSDVRAEGGRHHAERDARSAARPDHRRTRGHGQVWQPRASFCGCHRALAPSTSALGRSGEVRSRTYTAALG
ncbi:hypothetical protein DZF91_10705 [Actinomadura logoneensis]|uniref:Uncharacterized protein n=1 Tax=Actinomadura logoneensis TaxID=2293572 RepID=A0A372JQL5_9ACTN|nr:hypothetical protein [Actinomadura logoneensis]RFU41638.1 hypothetical protein DZF91_10705 [Actinomadura logoneensis]